MVSIIENGVLQSALNNLINDSGKNLSKMLDINLNVFVKELKKENYDGWFSSIENGPTVEVALINNTDLYEIINSNKCNENWSYSSYNNPNTFNLTPQDWGKKYKINTQEKPVILKINKIYKPMIKKYINRYRNINDKTAFYIVLKNATIEYINSPYKKIKWCISDKLL